MSLTKDVVGIAVIGGALVIGIIVLSHKAGAGAGALQGIGSTLTGSAPPGYTSLNDAPFGGIFGGNTLVPNSYFGNDNGVVGDTTGGTW